MLELLLALTLSSFVILANFHLSVIAARIYDDHIAQQKIWNALIRNQYVLREQFEKVNACSDLGCKVEVLGHFMRFHYINEQGEFVHYDFYQKGNGFYIKKANEVSSKLTSGLARWSFSFIAINDRHQLSIVAKQNLSSSLQVKGVIVHWVYRVAKHVYTYDQWLKWSINQ